MNNAKSANWLSLFKNTVLIVFLMVLFFNLSDVRGRFFLSDRWLTLYLYSCLSLVTVFFVKKYFSSRKLNERRKSHQQIASAMQKKSLASRSLDYFRFLLIYLGFFVLFFFINYILLIFPGLLMKYSLINTEKNHMQATIIQLHCHRYMKGGWTTEFDLLLANGENIKIEFSYDLCNYVDQETNGRQTAQRLLQGKKIELNNLQSFFGILYLYDWKVV